MAKKAKKAAGSGKKKGGMRKRGRMLVWCQAYKSRHQRERNKMKKLRIHYAKHVNDKVAYNALHKLEIVLA
jgi:hypothetical protein